MRAINLFAGAGGTTLGMLDAGCDVTGFELDQDCLLTHRTNGLDCQSTDLSTWEVADWRAYAAAVGGVDVVWGSPPCQPFSETGVGAGELDPKDGMPAFLTAVDGLDAPLVIFENVRGLMFQQHREYWAWCIGSIKRLGYKVAFQVLNCADYGVPQSRKRLFLVATKRRNTIEWPDPTHGKPGNAQGLPAWVTLADGLGWDEATARSRALHGPTDDECLWVLERPAATVVATFSPERMAPPVYRLDKGQSRQNAKGTVILTQYESALLQGFPEDHLFVGNKKSIFRQIGNAVPPIMAELMIEANT